MAKRVMTTRAPFSLARMARDWEAEAERAREKGARVVMTRFAIVLGEGGGALEQLARATRWCVAGPLGSGRQWLSWIHREDLMAAVLFLLQHRELRGTFNLSSPNPRRQVELIRTLGKVLHRPTLLPIPAVALRLVLGEFADGVLFSQRMVPRRLRKAGFEFQFPDLEPALRDIFELILSLQDPIALCECHTDFFAAFFFGGAISFGFWSSFFKSAGGSPVAAFSMLPPSSRAISIRRRSETTERGRVSAMSLVLACGSRCLIRSQVLLPPW